tara:strand:- start:393 stop:740 length:348 start_codon:yes stop_codon:yes gene_type:complete
MAISHSTTISLTVLNNSKNIVSKVKVMLVSSDDSDPEATEIQFNYKYTLDTSAGNSSSDFILWSKLTESTVLSWKDKEGQVILDAINDAKTYHETKIAGILSPPTPTEIEKSNPW